MAMLNGAACPLTEDCDILFIPYGSAVLFFVDIGRRVSRRNLNSILHLSVVSYVWERLIRIRRSCQSATPRPLVATAANLLASSDSWFASLRGMLPHMHFQPILRAM
jgi:hypothetical protein